MDLYKLIKITIDNTVSSCMTKLS